MVVLPPSGPGPGYLLRVSACQGREDLTAFSSVPGPPPGLGLGFPPTPPLFLTTACLQALASPQKSRDSRLGAPPTGFCPPPSPAPRATPGSHAGGPPRVPIPEPHKASPGPYTLSQRVPAARLARLSHVYKQ